MKISLKRPDEMMEEQVMAYRALFLERGENANGSCGLRLCDKYTDWLDRVRKVSANHVPDRTPSDTYCATNLDGQLLGMIDIRQELRPAHYDKGHIGYSVHPDWRGRGIATEMLRQACMHCTRIGIMTVVMSCLCTNIASQRVIEKNSGILQYRFYSEGNYYFLYEIAATQHK